MHVLWSQGTCPRAPQGEAERSGVLHEWGVLTPPLTLALPWAPRREQQDVSANRQPQAPPQGQGHGACLASPGAGGANSICTHHDGSTKWLLVQVWPQSGWEETRLNSHSRSYRKAHCHSHAARPILSAKRGCISSCFLGPEGRKVNDLVNHYDHSHAVDKIWKNQHIKTIPTLSQNKTH